MCGPDGGGEQSHTPAEDALWEMVQRLVVIKKLLAAAFPPPTWGLPRLPWSSKGRL